VGPTPTLPPHAQPPPGSHQHHPRRPGPHDDRDLVLNAVQPPATAKPEPDADLALEEAAVRAHRELAQAHRTTHAPQEPEPLGRRLPVPLDGAREGVER
jgi:hypothetical protein